MASKSNKNSSEELQESLSLKEFIQAVRNDLVKSEEERLMRGEPPLFKVDTLDIEASVIVKKKVEGKSGVNIQVLSLGASGGKEQEAGHKITLSLSAVEGVTPLLGRISPEDLKNFLEEEESDTPSETVIGLYPAMEGLEEFNPNISGGLLIADDDEEMLSE